MQYPKTRPPYGWVVLGLAWVILSSPEARAKPIAPGVFCETYPDVAVCQDHQPACTYCHTTPPAKNAFGEALSAHLLVGEARPLSNAAFRMGLSDALMTIEAQDADEDGTGNLEEILAGTLPADETSVPRASTACPTPRDANGYDVCRYDPVHVFRKIHLDFCGYSPSFEDVEQFSQRANQMGELHAVLDGCLDSDYWLGRHGALWRLAHRKIRPEQAIKSGEDAGVLPLADYYDDYNLFVYTQIDNHDAREVLTAQYFVFYEEDASPPYQAYPISVFEDLALRGEEVAQLVETSRRAGMLTTRWNLMLNTMFTAMPRTTAAQAYRAYLGFDIAKLEGLSPVENEPVDYDDKGVTQAACATCHSTLDPLTYPFTRYAGFASGPDGIPFTYEPGRMQALAPLEGPRLADTPEAGVLFGQPVSDLTAWAEVAANSDAFARATVMDYWTLLMGGPPAPDETEAFVRLWQGLKNEQDYGVERMLHALIETEVYGVP